MGRFVRFNIVGLAGLGVQLCLVWILTTAGASPLGASAAAVLMTLGHNFAWHWCWTWADRRPTQLLPAWWRFFCANGVVSLAGTFTLIPSLIGPLHLAAVPANFVVIAAAGLVNFWLADAIAFRGAVSSKHADRRPAPQRPRSPAEPAQGVAGCRTRAL